MRPPKPRMIKENKDVPEPPTPPPPRRITTGGGWPLEYWRWSMTTTEKMIYVVMFIVAVVAIAGLFHMKAGIDCPCPLTEWEEAE